MKSKEIRVRNLPQDDVPYDVVNVKPTVFLAIAMVAGISILWIRSYLQIVGVMVIMVSLFSLLMLPDRVLCELHHDYMVFYNRHERTECTIIYYEDIISWHYEWNPSSDQIVVSLVDGSVQTQELYGKHRIAKWLNLFAAGKEVKRVNRKKER